MHNKVIEFQDLDFILPTTGFLTSPQPLPLPSHSLGCPWLCFLQRKSGWKTQKKKEMDLIDTVNLVLAPFGFERWSPMILSLRGWSFGLLFPVSFNHYSFLVWTLLLHFWGVWRVQSLDGRKIVPSPNLVWERFNSPPPFGINYWHMIQCFRDFLMNFI